MTEDNAPQRYGAWLFGAAVVGLFIVGAVFRSWGLGTLDFWSDEARWAARLAYKSMVESGFRPIGYFWLSQQLDIFRNQELVLRLPSYIGGLGMIVCVYLAARRLGQGHATVLLAVFLVALHPELIAFAKEYKPYSLETLVHSGLTAWALACYARRSVGPAFVATAGIAFLFCYNVVFLYPGLVLVVVLTRYRAAATALVRRIGSLPYAVLSILAVAGILAAAASHSLLSELVAAERQSAYWGEKYGVFPMGLGVLEAAAWYLRKTWAMITWPGDQRGFLPGAGAVAWAIGLAYIAGLVALVTHRRTVELALLVGPLALAAVANMLGYWPYGVFRTNYFLMPGVVLVATYGVHWLAARPVLKPAAIGFVVLVMLLSVPPDVSHYRTKQWADRVPSPQLTEVFYDIQRRMSAESADVNVIIAEQHSWRPLWYYLEFSPWGRDAFADIRAGSTLVRGAFNDVDALAVQLEEIYAAAVAAGADTRIWLVYTPQTVFAPILSHPRVLERGVYQNRYATHDPDYHPVLVELRIPAAAQAAPR